MDGAGHGDDAAVLHLDRDLLHFAQRGKEAFDAGLAVGRLDGVTDGAGVQVMHFTGDDEGGGLVM